MPSNKGLPILAVPKAGTIVSRQIGLDDILSKKPIPNEVGILLDSSLSTIDAKRLITAITSLVKKVNVNELSLCLSCRCSRDSGAIITNGLQSLKGIKNIALVLNANPGPASKLARATIRSLQNNQPVTKGVSLIVLPREIRHSIIDYVFNVGYAQRVMIDSRNYGAQGSCCEFCMPAKAIEHGHCACSHLVGGYSTTCRCDQTRLALFRVNRSLYADSTYVLFSTNRFVTAGLTPTFKFFTNLSNEALKVMRMIDIKIEYTEYALFMERIPEEFTKIISIIKEKCTLNRLHLSFDSAGDDTEVANWPGEDLVLLDKMRLNIVEALKPLKGLERLDIYLSHSTPEEEDKMEKAVMGKDYDAIALGKLHMFVRNALDVHSHDDDSSYVPSTGDDDSTDDDDEYEYDEQDSEDDNASG